jgi:radical SAM superfamily enzyme YgiQ (UPF0313 family)
MWNEDHDGKGFRSVRQYSEDYIENFLTELVEKYRIRHIFFDDDTFNLGDAHVLKVCRVMRKLKIPWGAMCRLDTVSMDTWRCMRESGCFWMRIGFESGSQWVVDNIVNKRLDLAKAREVAIALHEMGFFMHGTFTYGLPGETVEQMMETKRYIKSIPLDTYQESGTGEMDGTPLALLRSEGHLDNYSGAVLDDDYNKISDGGEKIRRLASRLKEV